MRGTSCTPRSAGSPRIIRLTCLPTRPISSRRTRLGVLAAFAAHPRIAAFWRPRFRRFAEWFAASEAARRKDVVAVLPEIAGSLGFVAPAGPFKLTARADRIDRLESGALIVTDYKSQTVPSDRQVLAGVSPQLALEAAIAIAGGFEGLAAAPVAGLRYIRAGGGDPPGEERMVKIDDPARLAAETLAGVERLIGRFDDPNTPYRALRRPDYARRHAFDAYAHLARFKEWTDAEGEDD
ncbi:MAG: PD-(D/E)XK nuclease family protein [Hyphomicrobiaceae bacterium]